MTPRAEDLEPNPATKDPDEAGEPAGALGVTNTADGEPKEPMPFYSVCPHPPGPDGLPCYITDNHPTQEAADKRLTEHLAEHMTGKAMPELYDSAAYTGDPLDAETRKLARAALKELDETGRIAIREADPE